MSANPTARETARIIEEYIDQRPDATAWLTKPLERSVGINADTWRRRLTAAPQRHAEAVRVALDALQDGPAGSRGTDHITRANLAALAGIGSTPEANVGLFVATQMWGSGTTNGRGPRFTDAALNDPRLADTLASTRELARSGDLSSAHRTFHLNGVGPSFFTKWFWSSTLDIDPPRRPLILDVRVIETINKLGWHLRQAARRRADRYEAYVDFAHEVATATSAVSSAEYFEAMLFDNSDDSLLAWLRSR